MEILITNHSKGIYNKPLKEVYPNCTVEHDVSNIYCIGNSFYVYVFDSVPFVRNIPNNKIWFESNIHHLKPFKN